MWIDVDSVIIRIIPAGSVRFSARATTLVFAGEDPKALPPHEYRSQGLPWEVQIFLKAPLRGAYFITSKALPGTSSGTQEAATREISAEVIVIAAYKM